MTNIILIQNSLNYDKINNVIYNFMAFVKTKQKVMGYLHISNLYKDQTILLFKECYALEKIHGTSAHISWNNESKEIRYFSGGEEHEKFIQLFDNDILTNSFLELFPNSNVVIYGEAYGGKQQGMSNTYGKELKFIAFDVMINNKWLEVPNAVSVCSYINIEFVDYVQIETTIDAINNERDKPSIQSIRNDVGNNNKREGVVLRPLIELITKNGDRVIAKHKGDDFKETKTKREIDPDKMIVLENAQSIANEWVTEMRLNHILDKLPKTIGMENAKVIIQAMVEDVYREGKGEIIEGKEVTRQIGRQTIILFKELLNNKLKSSA